MADGPKTLVSSTHIRPMVERIVASASRRTRHQTIRVVYLAILVGVAAVGMLLSTSLGGSVSLRGLAAAASGVFEVVAIVEVAAICLLTPIFMAGAIEQESSPRTWDLLLTTPLSSMGIVLGNFLGRVSLVLMLIVASLPVLLVLQVFGGVSPRTILLAGGIAACTAVVVAAAAVMLSATRTGGRRAVLLFSAGVLVALIVTWAMDAALRVPIPGGLGAASTTWATPLNPFLALQTALRPSQYVITAHTTGGLSGFWLGHPVAAFASTSLVAAALMLVWSTLRVRLIGPLFGRAADGAHRKRAPRPVGLNAIAWRASIGRPRLHWDTAARWGWAAMAALGLVVVLSLLGAGLIPPSTARLILLAMLALEVGLVILAAATIAAQSVTRDREQGTLDLLLTTPIQPGPYLWGKVEGIARGLLPLLLAPMFTAGLLGLLIVTAGPNSPFGATTVEGGTPTFLGAWGAAFGLAISIGPFTALCIAVGLHWSLRSRRSSVATVVTILIIALLAGLLVPCVSSASGIPWFGLPIVSVCPLAAVLLAMDSGPLLAESGLSRDAAEWVLLGGGVLSGALWAVLTLMVLKTTTRTFVTTMRNLAGSHTH
jgi:ABC-type transport system involved in multi-copper enzyme maturation permease subunit